MNLSKLLRQVEDTEVSKSPRTCGSGHGGEVTNLQVFTQDFFFTMDKDTIVLKKQISQFFSPNKIKRMNGITNVRYGVAEGLGISLSSSGLLTAVPM